MTSTQEFRTSPRAGWAAPAALVPVGVPTCLAAFWLLSLWGGTRAPGYDLVQDTLSALAARGPGDSVWGLAAGLALVLAHALARWGCGTGGSACPRRCWQQPRSPGSR